MTLLYSFAVFDRSGDADRIRRGYRIAALLAIEAGVPIVPVGIKNSNKTFGRKTVPAMTGSQLKEILRPLLTDRSRRS